MKAYIHTVGGRPFNEECEVAWRGFEKLGVECVPFSDNDVLDAAAREDVVVGGMLVTGHALALRDVKPPEIDYPDSLKVFFDRRIWRCAIGDISEPSLPLFVKPYREKDLPGVVAATMGDLADYVAKGENYPVWCSDPVEFVSEWRCFVRHGRLIGAACYRGDSTLTPDWWAARDMVERLHIDLDDWRLFFTPAGYGLDVGVTADGRTLLVEVNDGYALGCYGLNETAYALLLASRWSQLVGIEDPFTGARAPAVEGPLGTAMSDPLWTDPQFGRHGVSIPACEPDLPRYMWGVAANVREYPYAMTEKQAAKRRRGSKHFAPGTLVWILEESWDPGYERMPVVGKKKGTHRYIRKVMDVNELENFRPKKTYSPTVMSWMIGARTNIENYGDDSCRRGFHGNRFLTNWGYDAAKWFAEFWTKRTSAS